MDFFIREREKGRNVRKKRKKERERERKKEKLERKGWKEVYQKVRVLFFYTATLILLFLFCFTSFTVGSCCSHYRSERASRKKEEKEKKKKKKEKEKEEKEKEEKEEKEKKSKRKKTVTSLFRSDESRTTTFSFPTNLLCKIFFPYIPIWKKYF